MAKAGRPKKGSAGLPKWFDIEKYRPVANFKAIDWFQQLAFRRSLSDAIQYLVKNNKEKIEDFLKEALTLLKSDPIITRSRIHDAPLKQQHAFGQMLEALDRMLGIALSNMMATPAGIRGITYSDLARLSCSLALEKKPLTVVGDGQHTLKELIQAEFRKLKRQGRTVGIKSTSVKVKTHLARQGLSLSDVPVAGRHVAVVANKNLSDGGTPKICTDEIKAKYTALCQQIYEKFGTEYVGIDLIEDMRTGEIRAFILELNGSPGFKHFVRSGTENAEMVKQVFVAAFRAAYQKKKEALRPSDLSPKILEVPSERLVA